MSEPTEPTTPETDDRRVLTVRVGAAEEVFDDLEERFASLDAGDHPDPQFEVVLQHEADLERLLRPTNVELLRTIARNDPASIREAARLVDRDVRQVHDNLVELDRMNLVRLDEDGRAKRPRVWYDEIDIQLPISGAGDSAAPA